MPNLNKDALDIWNALRPMIDKEIERRTMGMVQRRKAKVTTAPSLVTQKIGVTEPFGDQYFIPFNTNLSTAQVGDVVWVEFMYGATNAFASMYASADSKDVTVGGVLDVVNRRCSATLSSAGWYRVFLYSSTNDDELAGGKSANIRITITREGIAGNSFRNEVHFIDFSLAYGSYIFSNETSVTQSFAIDKIRYGYDLTNHFGFIDIHCKRNDSNPITVSFNVATDLETQGEMASVEPYSVADAPSGETVVTTHDFAEIVPYVGTNANGTYYKYPDGTLICTKRVNFGNIQSSGWTAWGAWYESTNKYDAGDWPAAFTEVPTLSATQVQNGTYTGVAVAELWMDRTTTKIGKTYFYRPSAASTSSVTYDFIGIGKWK